MNFMGAQVGDTLYVKLALTQYSILDVELTVESVGGNEIVAVYDDIAEMSKIPFKFRRTDGIAFDLPKRYSKATCWIMRYHTDRINSVR